MRPELSWQRTKERRRANESPGVLELKSTKKGLQTGLPYETIYREFLAVLWSGLRKCGQKGKKKDVLASALPSARHSNNDFDRVLTALDDGEDLSTDEEGDDHGEGSADEDQDMSGGGGPGEDDEDEAQGNVGGGTGDDEDEGNGNQQNEPGAHMDDDSD
ncbi:hypothetical protein FB45DRAFT_1021409 [Roridomyces roridus]|uniref:Uncharacterized protein n=1 Tax=Roridomyces roridus TaxID=1738132 RepID=A0AAD7FBJ3_9AGAR|nr:hypothetical protein FB45DRAFT_1039276 [Roridomyces roridus]KAJ7644658.1 hypothetical protein FB45DRAFT_1021409 [Roridomyces roridus]